MDNFDIKLAPGNLHRTGLKWLYKWKWRFLPLNEALASRAVFVIVSGSDGQVDGNTFGAS